LQLVSPNFDKDIPIFLAHGKADSTIKIGYGRAAKKLLEWEEIGARNVRFEEYEGMSHSSSEEEMNDLEEWLKGIIDV
jgi:predicted esterase